MSVYTGKSVENLLLQTMFVKEVPTDTTLFIVESALASVVLSPEYGVNPIKSFFKQLVVLLGRCAYMLPNEMRITNDYFFDPGDLSNLFASSAEDINGYELPLFSANPRCGSGSVLFVYSEIEGLSVVVKNVSIRNIAELPVMCFSFLCQLLVETFDLSKVGQAQIWANEFNYDPLKDSMKPVMRYGFRYELPWRGPLVFPGAPSVEHWLSELEMFFDQPEAIGFTNTFFKKIAFPVYASSKGTLVGKYLQSTCWGKAITLWLDYQETKAILAAEKKNSSQ